MLRISNSPLFNWNKIQVYRGCFKHCHSQFSQVHIECEGKDFMVLFEDHGPRQNSGIVMALHGDPGSSDNFQDIVKPLVEQNLRVLIPNFPGYGTYSPSGFDEMLNPAARCQFLTNFLTALGVERVDVLIAHSAGGWAGIHFAARNPSIRSTAFLNPCAHRPHVASRPFWLLRSLAFILKFPLFARILKPSIRRAYKRTGFDVNVTKEFTIPLRYVGSVDYKQLNVDIPILRARGLPSLVTMTMNDKIVEWQVPSEFSKLIGIPQENFVHYNSDGVVEGAEKNDFLVDGIYKKTMVMSRGGHFVHRAFAERIVEHILELLTQVNHPAPK